MKSTSVMVVLAVLLGLAVGVGSSAYRFGSKPTYGFSKPSSGELGAAPASSGRPRAEVIGSAVHDFGVMSRDETRSHTFVVKNVGDAPLELRFLEKSCQCTDVTMTRSVLKPDEITEINLSWRPKNYGLDFHQVARFETNDPARFELDLTIQGEVRQILRPVPSSVSFDNLLPNRGRDVLVRVYGYRDENLQLTDVSFLNKENKDYFSAEVSPLDEATLAAEPGAKSGVNVTLSLKPGLPLGPFFQRVRMTTNLPNVEPIEIPVQGTISGNIRVFGHGFDSQTNILSMGTLSGSEPHTRKLWLLVTGDGAEASDLSLGEIEPSGILEAFLEPPIKSGRTVRYPLTIRITPDGRLVNRLGNKQGPFGRIVVQTNQEHAKQLVIKLAFLLEASP